MSSNPASPPGTASIRLVGRDDLPHIVNVHLAAFPESSLSALGAEAVRRYYEWQLTGPHECVALGAYVGETLVGFCFGGVFRGALSGFVRKNRNFLIRRVLTHPWLAANPVFREHLAQGVRILRRRKKTAAPPKAAVRSFGILSIATHPEHWGHGAGKLLMHEAERIARERGFAQMDLSVSPKNTRAIAFYEKLGWQRIPQGESWRGLMHKALP